jgi:hypothetical protein
MCSHNPSEKNKRKKRQSIPNAMDKKAPNDREEGK